MLFILVMTSGEALAQEERKVVKLSGYVVGGDSSTVQAGVVVYVPGTNRGTLTLADGYYALSVLVGDSLVVSALGFEKQYIRIPESKSSFHFTADIHLKEAVIKLPAVKVIP